MTSPPPDSPVPATPSAPAPTDARGPSSATVRLVREPSSARLRRFALAALVVTLAWVVLVPWLYHRYTATLGGGDLDLEAPYEVWATKLRGSDCGSYLGAAVGFAEGHGIAIRTEANGQTVWSPFVYQVPGASFFIGEMIKLFGGQHVRPYFFAVCVLHLLTVLGVMGLALPFTRRVGSLVGVGLLSLFCIPVLALEFSWMLTGSEAIAHLPLVLALLVLQAWWLRGRDSWRFTLVSAIAFGVFLGLATYARGIYGTFGIFVGLCVVLVSVRGGSWKRALLFAMVGVAVLKAAQLPWELRNKRLTGQAFMCSSQFHACGLWLGIWSDWRLSEKYFGTESAMGWGDYLNHDVAEGLYKEVSSDPVNGSPKAARAFAHELMEHPVEAAWFKLKGYDTLWLGLRADRESRFFCGVSLLVYLWFLATNWRGMSPALWTFPLFMLLLSVIVQHEPRLTHPLYLLNTPIAFGVLWEQRRDKRKTLLAWREETGEGLRAGARRTGGP